MKSTSLHVVTLAMAFAALVGPSSAWAQPASAMDPKPPFVRIPVADLEASRTFYSEVLGFLFGVRADGRNVGLLSDLKITLSQQPNADSAHAIHLGVEVEDGLEDVLDLAEVHGGSVEGVITHTADGSSASIRDPDGNAITVRQTPPSESTQSPTIDRWANMVLTDITMLRDSDWQCAFIEAEVLGFRNAAVQFPNGRMPLSEVDLYIVRIIEGALPDSSNFYSNAVHWATPTSGPSHTTGPHMPASQGWLLPGDHVVALVYAPPHPPPADSRWAYKENVFEIRTAVLVAPDGSLSVVDHVHAPTGSNRYRVDPATVPLDEYHRSFRVVEGSLDDIEQAVERFRGGWWRPGLSSWCTVSLPLAAAASDSIPDSKPGGEDDEPR